MATFEQIGRYQIKRELGRGGMSTVYLAFDPNVDRHVALKLLPREFLHHPTFRERFDREAKIIAALEHPAIVPIYDFGEDESQPFFVMRFMRGGSLAEKIRNGPLPLNQAVEILQRIGSALDHAHSKGVIHRDLKPANILFDQYNKAYLGDFGIARLQETGASLTGTVYLGTPAYMSPEQISSDKELTGRADIYALGVILYEVLTGDKPYKAETAAGLALKHVTDPVPRILSAKPDLPPDFDQIISRAMAKDPDDRYPSAVDLTSEVSLLAVGGTIAAAAAGEAGDATMIMGDDLTSAEGDEATRVLASNQTSAGKAAAGAAVGAAALAGAGSAGAAGAAVGTGTGEITGGAAAAGKRSYVPFAVAGMVILAVICIAVAAVAIFGSGDFLSGIFGEDTPTPTLVPTLTNTATREPTETPTEQPTATPTATREPTNTATAAASPSPTEEVAVPTLRPTSTLLPTDTPRPTRPPATATSPPPTAPPPPPTSAPQPTSPPRPQPTSPPKATPIP